MHDNSWMSVGKPEQRIDAMEKAAGTVTYVGDFNAPGLLHAKLVTSTEAHANIQSIDD
ncbi:hypothetical protein [Caldifermentibacillus hisashii]|uniref:hypothetical protein n=1 Tax=Caldifermentibacillus hisashii TaxID=996558 RepID=UPI00310164EA